MTTRTLRYRRWTISLLAAAAGVWAIAAFQPTLFDEPITAQTRQAGHELFLHEWTPHDARSHGDGLGPVFNARSCVACHFQGGVGGAGDNRHNVTSYEVHPNLREKYLQTGLVHAFAVDDAYAETEQLLKQRFPVIKGGDRVVGGCTVRFEDFDPVHTSSTNSIALFGDGLIDRISDSILRMNYAKASWGQIRQEIRGNMQTIGPGRPRILDDGRIGKFGWKSQFATLEEFVAAACANELGLGNPLVEQAKSLGSDHTAEQPDLTRRELVQLVSFVDALPAPVQVMPFGDKERARAVRGESLFTSIGCAVCHTPSLGSAVGLYSDLLLHSLTSKEGDGYRHEIQVEVPLPDTHPTPDEWRTAPLWGVADSAPYFHDGASPTLQDAIARHAGDARVVKKAYLNMSAADREAILAFLETLKAPAAAAPAQAHPATDTVAASK
jgi:CxxC motif-containing protein (DUF1111 family)